MSNKNLLVMLGSPHKEGATSKMAALLCEAFTAKAWDCQVIDIYNADLKPCIGCMACRKTGQCVIHDGIEQIRDALISCDLAVLAVPVYFANVPGPVKTLFDRLSGAVLDSHLKPRMKKSQGYILMTSCSTPAPFDRFSGQSSGALRAMNEFFKMAGMTCRRKMVYPAANSDNELPVKIQNKIRRLVP